MKKILTYLSLSLMAFAVNAQNYENESAPNKEYKVFFESNSYELDAEAKRELLSLNEYLTGVSLSRISLQAATDDKGNNSNNQLLATNRANTVLQFLIDEGYNKTIISVDQPILLTSDLANDSEARRKEYRSVLVRVWADDNDLSNLSYNEIDAFFATEKKEAQQYFTFEAKTGMVVTGKKGTRLKIPANCFVHTDGGAVEGPVVFALQEALSYGDMLKQDLSTTSGNKMLETGGMFFIAATDVNGKELKMKDGASIEASLPTAQSTLPGMQVFEGVNDPHGDLDWAATGRAVNVANRTDSKGFQDYSLAEVEQAIIDLKALTQSSKVGAMPKVKSSQLNAPIYPNIEKPKAPQRASFFETYPQRAKESDVNYRKRVYMKYQNANKSYLNKKIDYNQKMSEYRRDSIRYAFATNNANGSVAQYNDYCERLRAYTKDILKIISVGDYKEYNSMIWKIAAPLDFKEQRLESFKDNMASLQSDIDAQIKAKWPFEDLKERLEGFEEFEYNVRKHWDLKHVFESIDNYNIRYSELTEESKGVFRIDPRITDMKAQVGEIEQILAKELWTKKDIKTLEHFKFGFTDMGGSLLNKDVLDKMHKNFIQYKRKLKSFMDIELDMNTLRADYRARCAKYGLLTADEVNKMYASAMKISSLGWINCDRFIEEKGPKMDMQILVENQSNTAIYVVFEDINSMIKAKYINGEYVVKNLPAGKKVKVIGIHITGQSAEVFIENTVVSNGQLRPQFEAKTMDELRSIMDRV